jgi:hypothetical protein
MKCKQTHSLFSERLDGELQPSKQHAFDEHTGTCSTCASEWQEFQQAVGALRDVGVTQVSEQYVDSLVTAVLDSEESARTSRSTSSSRWSLVASHGAALLAGAAAMLLLFEFGNSVASPDFNDPLQLPIANSEGMWFLNSGGGTVQRSSELIPLAKGELPLRAGDHMLVAPGSQLQYRSPAGDLIEFEVASTVTPEARIEYVDRVVTQVEYVTRPTSYRSRELELALNFTGQCFVEMSDALGAQTAALARSTEAMEASQAEALTVAPDRFVAAAEPVRAPRLRRSSVPLTASKKPSSCTAALRT